MTLTVQRKYKNQKYTIGELYIDGIKFCDTLEDKDRGLFQNMPLSTIQDLKVYGETAIPTGKYKITLDVVSPKFSKYAFYNEVCEGKLPRLLNVPGFEGSLIHVADGSKGAELLLGCIGVGENKIKGGLLNGKETFRKLYAKLLEADSLNEELIINII